MLVILVVQGGIGYLQYFTGVPAGLVELHIIGAVATVWATLQLNLSLMAHPSAAPVVEPALARQ